MYKMFIAALFKIAKEKKNLEITQKSINGRTVIYLFKRILGSSGYYYYAFQHVNLKNIMLGRKGKKQKNIGRITQLIKSSKANKMKLHII